MYIKSPICAPNCECGNIRLSLAIMLFRATLLTDRRIRLITIVSKYGGPSQSALSRWLNIAHLYSRHTKLPGFLRTLLGSMVRKIAGLFWKLTVPEKRYFLNYKG